MITAVALMMVGFQRLPQNPSFDFSGLPQIRADQKIAFLTHSVTLEIDGTRDGYVDVSSTTGLKNPSNTDVTATLVIPRRRIGDSNSGQPGFEITATWDGKPLKLTPVSEHGTTENAGRAVKYASDLTVQVHFKPGATYGLRINYQVPIGKGGYEQKQRLVGYLFDGDKTVDQLNIAYRYGGHSVFRLPEVRPNMGWQIGERGAFLRQENYFPDNQLTYVAYYPGGF